MPHFAQITGVVVDRGGTRALSRDTLATLVDRIAARKPAAIGVDIVFNEPDRTSPEHLAALNALYGDWR